MKKIGCVLSGVMLVVLFSISVVWSVGLKLSMCGILWPGTEWMVESLGMASVMTGINPAILHISIWLATVGMGAWLLNSCIKGGVSRSG